MGFDIRKCSNCGKLFNSSGSRMCLDCQEELDRMFTEIREYLYKYPNSDVIEIANATGIEGKIILDFLRDGRLSVKSSNGLLTCERCGTGINSGRYCESCMSVISKDLSRVSSQLKSELNKEEEMREKARKAIRMHLDLDNN